MCTEGIALFFFLDAYSVFVCKVHYLLALFLCIAYHNKNPKAFLQNTTQSNIVVLQDQFLHKKNLSHIPEIKIDLSKTL